MTRYTECVECGGAARPILAYGVFYKAPFNRPPDGYVCEACHINETIESWDSEAIHAQAVEDSRDN